MELMRDKLIPSKRLKALQEEIAGFFNSEVLKRGGEFFHNPNYVLPEEM